MASDGAAATTGALIGRWLALGIVSYHVLVTPQLAPGAAATRPPAA